MLLKPGLMVQCGYQGRAVGARGHSLRWKMRFVLVGCGHTACRFVEQSRENLMSVQHILQMRWSWSSCSLRLRTHQVGMCYIQPCNVLRFKLIALVQGLCIPWALCTVNRSVVNGAAGTFTFKVLSCPGNPLWNLKDKICIFSLPTCVWSEWLWGRVEAGLECCLSPGIAQSLQRDWELEAENASTLFFNSPS